MNKSKLILSFLGYDNWDRPVYECGEDLYVDVDPRKNMPPSIHTKCNNKFNGEPDSPVGENVELVFVPSRVTW